MQFFEVESVVYRPETEHFKHFGFGTLVHLTRFVGQNTRLYKVVNRALFLRGRKRQFVFGVENHVVARKIRGPEIKHLYLTRFARTFHNAFALRKLTEKPYNLLRHEFDRRPYAFARSRHTRIFLLD